MQITRCLLLVALAACGSKENDGGGKTKERPAPWDVKINKVEQLDSVAPNKTYEEQGLGAKAPDGQTFVCVQFTVTNKNDKPEGLTTPELVDAKGTRHKVSMKAAGKYTPEDWKSDSVPPKADPGTSFKQHPCFEVPKDATTGMKLEYVDTGWGPKFPPWKTSVPL